MRIIARFPPLAAGRMGMFHRVRERECDRIIFSQSCATTIAVATMGVLTTCRRTLPPTRGARLHRRSKCSVSRTKLPPSWQSLTAVTCLRSLPRPRTDFRSPKPTRRKLKGGWTSCFSVTKNVQRLLLAADAVSYLGITMQLLVNSPFTFLQT